MPAASDVPPRGSIGLLSDPAFGGIFFGKLLSTTGVYIHGVAATIVVFRETGSLLLVGLVSILQCAPQLVLTPLGGAWADRGNARNQILAGRVLNAAATAGVVAWLWANPDAGVGPVVAAILMSSLMVGISFVIGGAAMQSVVPSLVRPVELATAAGLNATPMILSRVAGPLLGAFLVSRFDAAWAFAVAMSTHLVFVVILVLISLPKVLPRRAEVDYSVRAGLRHTWRDRPLFLLLLVTVAVGFGSDPSMTLAPGLADQLGGGAGLVGALSTSFGVGALLGIVLRPLADRLSGSARLATGGLWLLGLGLAGTSTATATWVAVVTFAIAGCGFLWAMTGATTLILQRTPIELRGRVMGLWLVAFVGARPFAAGIAGAVADLLSVSAAFAVAGAFVIVIALICRPAKLADGP